MCFKIDDAYEKRRLFSQLYIHSIRARRNYFYLAPIAPFVGPDGTASVAPFVGPDGTASVAPFMGPDSVSHHYGGR